jgi:hypothetical protein
LGAAARRDHFQWQLEALFGATPAALQWQVCEAVHTFDGHLLHFFSALQVLVSAETLPLNT